MNIALSSGVRDLMYACVTPVVYVVIFGMEVENQSATRLEYVKGSVLRVCSGDTLIGVALGQQSTFILQYVTHLL